MPFQKALLKQPSLIDSFVPGNVVQILSAFIQVGLNKSSLAQAGQ